MPQNPCLHAPDLCRASQVHSPGTPVLELPVFSRGFTSSCRHSKPGHLHLLFSAFLPSQFFTGMCACVCAQERAHPLHLCPTKSRPVLSLGVLSVQVGSSAHEALFQEQNAVY